MLQAKTILKISSIVLVIVFLIFVLLIATASFRGYIIDETIGQIVIGGYAKSTFDLSANDLEKTMALKKWFNDSNNYRWKQGTTSDFFRRFGAGTLNTFITQEGQCQEASELFYYMGTAIGLKVRRAFNSGEGHQWNEVLINGGWAHIDVSGGYDFNKPQMYELPGWDKNISVVYVIDNENKINITDKYTETSYLRLMVVDNNRPKFGAEIVLKSLFYDSNYPAYVGYTDSNGIFTLEVGDSNYALEVFDYLFFPVIIREAKVNYFETIPNEDKYIIVDMQNGQVLVNWWLIFIAILIASFFLAPFIIRKLKLFEK